MRNREQSFSAHLLFAIHNFVDPIIFPLCHLFFQQGSCSLFHFSSCASLSLFQVVFLSTVMFCIFSTPTVSLLTKDNQNYDIIQNSANIRCKNMQNSDYFFLTHLQYLISMIMSSYALLFCSFSASCPECFSCILSCWSNYKEKIKLCFPSKQPKEITTTDFLFICLLGSSKREGKRESIK